MAGTVEEEKAAPRRTRERRRSRSGCADGEHSMDSQPYLWERLDKDELARDMEGKAKRLKGKEGFYICFH